MTPVSSGSDALPPKSAPLAERLKAAMERAGYPSARALARALGTDGSLVGKWLNGKVRVIQSPRHRETLPKLLNTPPDYFMPPAVRTDRLAALEAEADDLRQAVLALLTTTAVLCKEVEALGGRVPAGAIEELERVGLRMQPGVPPQ